MPPVSESAWRSETGIGGSRILLQALNTARSASDLVGGQAGVMNAHQHVISKTGRRTVVMGP